LLSFCRSLFSLATSDTRYFSQFLLENASPPRPHCSVTKFSSKPVEWVQVLTKDSSGACHYLKFKKKKWEEKDFSGGWWCSCYRSSQYFWRSKAIPVSIPCTLCFQVHRGVRFLNLWCKLWKSQGQIHRSFGPKIWRVMYQLACCPDVCAWMLACPERLPPESCLPTLLLYPYFSFCFSSFLTMSLILGTVVSFRGVEQCSLSILQVHRYFSLLRTRTTCNKRRKKDKATPPSLFSRCRKYSLIKNKSSGTGEMAQRLRALAVLPEVTHMAVRNCLQLQFQGILHPNIDTHAVKTPKYVKINNN